MTFNRCSDRVIFWIENVGICIPFLPLALLNVIVVGPVWLIRKVIYGRKGQALVE